MVALSGPYSSSIAGPFFSKLNLPSLEARPSSWNDYWSATLYDVVGYLRLRFLQELIDLQSHFTVAE
ncbi:hypothetical protein PR003_g22665 [Phytophthora rubi]|uniref:Uncharacterized protein n=1 Tax=Phytophthora rubi TaxID=129364 RepID=A0A6A4D3S0_9STRA|nr:hypothetical protein PR003_g22665 [Phytophthora rubi]